MKILLAYISQHEHKWLATVYNEYIK